MHEKWLLEGRTHFPFLRYPSRGSVCQKHYTIRRADFFQVDAYLSFAMSRRESKIQQLNVLSAPS